MCVCNNFNSLNMPNALLDTGALVIQFKAKLFGNSERTTKLVSLLREIPRII